MYSHLFVSCLKSLKRLKNLKKIYLRKDQDDETKYLLKLLGGAKIGKSLTVGDLSPVFRRIHR